jgi:hypothetical protein
LAIGKCKSKKNKSGILLYFWLPAATQDGIWRPFSKKIRNLATQNSKQIASLLKKIAKKNPCKPVIDIGRRA